MSGMKRTKHHRTSKIPVRTLNRTPHLRPPTPECAQFTRRLRSARSPARLPWPFGRPHDCATHLLRAKKKRDDDRNLEVRLRVSCSHKKRLFFFFFTNPGSEGENFFECQIGWDWFLLPFVCHPLLLEYARWRCCFWWW